MEDNLYCYTPGEMAALIGGDATPGSKAAFEKHILKCAACRREWIEVSLAHALPVEQPPREVQEAIKAAPLIQRRARRAPVSERTYTGARVAALIAACAFVAVVLALVSSSPTPEVTPVTPAPFADKTPATPPESQQVEPEEQLALPVKKEVEKKVESMPLPEPEEEVVVVERREPEAPEVTAVPEPQEKLVQKPDVEQVPEKPAEKFEPRTTTDKLAQEKDKPSPDTPEVRGEKLAFKLSPDDGKLFRKLHRNALLSVAAQEQEIKKQAQRDAMKFDPILGKPPGGGPVTGPKQGPEAPKEQPKQDPANNPNSPGTLPRIDELRKKGKIPEQPKGESEPKEEPKQEPVKDAPKEQPKSGPEKGPGRSPVSPKQPAVPAPAKKGLAQLPEITPEEIQRLAGKAGFEPVTLPGLKKGVLLARAELVEDSTGRKAVHLFYYYSGTGFSVFERSTARADERHSYQALYNGKGKTRTLMWAAGKREFIIVAQKLSRREMHAIEASVRDLLK